ncbi:MAG: hypothetical protein B0D92_07125 [Spirochaeta sp. LUC14_002_19_P3]|nr:MAG: hypothetical protein B0D92_07125 [Spirochaeta sp. LUC14_002_19_P3]
MDIPIIFWLFIFLGGMASGFIDSIAGGGGLISLPVLLAVGFPPHLAIGTNKLQSVFGSGMAALRYTGKKLVVWQKIWPGVLTSLFASVLGAWTLTRIEAAALEMALPFILLALWCYVAFKKNLGNQRGQARMRDGLFYPAAGSLFGFYDGFLGPGTGSFWTISQVSLIGMDLKQATAASKPPNFASNIGSLIFFLIAGKAVLAAGLTMAAGQLIGSWLGSYLVIQHQPRFIRPFFLAVVAAIVIKLMGENFGLF